MKNQVEVMDVQTGKFPIALATEAAQITLTLDEARSLKFNLEVAILTAEGYGNERTN
jgi:hypothetical protein